MRAPESGVVISALCPTRPINGSLSHLLVLASATSGLNLAATPQLPPGGFGALRLQQLLGVTECGTLRPGRARPRLSTSALTDRNILSFQLSNMFNLKMSICPSVVLVFFFELTH